MNENHKIYPSITLDVLFLDHIKREFSIQYLRVYEYFLAIIMMMTSRCAHVFCDRQYIARLYDKDVADTIRLQYVGTVTK